MRRTSAVAVLSLALSGLALSACASMPPAGANRAVVFFTEFSANLDQPAQQAISEAAGRAARNPSSPVWVTGYADQTGSARANDLLSQLRAQVVKDQLVLDGVQPARIIDAGRGAVPSVGTTQESRRVGIVVEGQ